MGKYAFIFLFLLACIPAFSQLSQKSEVGGGLGVFSYSGDLVRNFDFLSSKPAATFFYRRNLNKVVSFKIGATFGKIGASDRRRPIDVFATQRASSFNLTLMEVAGTFEYHFVDWRDDKRRLRITPYLFGGAGLFVFSGNKTKPTEYSNLQVCIPFGGGVKYVLNPKWYLSAEFGVRKTFFDYLDNVSGTDPSYKTFNTANAFDNDTYYFVGLSLTRTFYDIPCPVSPYKKRL
jgi:Domain of unknown function (DUF6089)